MKSIHYTIAPDIFALHPGYIRGLVVARIRNSEQDISVEGCLRDAEAALQRAYTADTLTTAPNIIAWRDAVKAFGINPGEFRPAHEALSRRVVQGKPLPFINAAVCIGNAQSLKHLTPVGVHPLDDVGPEVTLRRSDGTERFVAFGSDKAVAPRQGEPVFTEGRNVLARGWVWRQAQSSITLPQTRTIVAHIDVLPPLSMSDAKQICSEVICLLTQHCEAECRTHFITKETPAAVLSA